MQENLVKISELIGNRIDVKYSLTFKLLTRNKNLKLKYKPLEYFISMPPQYGANESATDWTSESTTRYIRITDIDEYGNLRQDDIKTAETVEEKYLLEENDILFARTGATAGKCLIYKNSYGKAIFAGYLIRFKLNPELINPDFLFYYTQLNHYKNWVKSIQRPSGQPNINSKEFSSLEIPIFSTNNKENLEIQSQIVKIMQKAYENKQQKEDKAKELIDSIDDFVLNQIGIKIPQVENKKDFTVKFKELINNRLDPYYFQPKFISKYQAIRTSQYKTVLLEDLMIQLMNGTEIRTYSDKGYRYLRVTDLSEFNINNDNPRYVDVAEIPERLKLSNEDFLISRSGSLGLVSAVKEEIIDSILSSHIFKITLDVSKIIPEYMEVYLRSTLGQFQFFQKNNGGIIPEINQSALKSIEIVLPPMGIQKDIANEYQKRLQKVKQLQREAKDELEKAKEQVEKIILGE